NFRAGARFFNTARLQIRGRTGSPRNPSASVENERSGPRRFGGPGARRSIPEGKSMKRTKLLMILALSALATNLAACHLQVEQILAVQPSSQMNIDVATPFDLPPVSQALEGGNVMSIDIWISLFDLILGDFEGDISVEELLIAAPGVNILVPTGRICIVPDAANPGGGTFEANLHSKTATFDVPINTPAVFGNAALGSFPFPFVLQSTLP